MKKAPVKKKAGRRPSSLEDSFEKMILNHVWGEYEREKKGLIPGRRFRCDFWFPNMNLVVEIDGIGGRRPNGHRTGVGITRDREKDALLQLQGIRVLRFTTYHFKENHGQYIVDIMDEAFRLWNKKGAAA